MNDGGLEGRNVLPPKLIATMTAPHADIPGTDREYGYGLQLSEHRGMRSVEHGGSRAGYGSLIRMLPAQRVAVIILANRSGANLPATADALIGSLVKLAPERPRPAAHAIQTSGAAGYAGTYRNGDSKLSLYVRDGGLYMKTGGRELMLEYLHAGGRSYVRTPE